MVTIESLIDKKYPHYGQEGNLSRVVAAVKVLDQDLRDELVVRLRGKELVGKPVVVEGRSIPALNIHRSMSLVGAALSLQFLRDASDTDGSGAGARVGHGIKIISR